MIRQLTVGNRLLARLSPDDFALLAPHLVLAGYEQGTVLVETEEPAVDVYFPEGGVISIVARSPEGHQAEVGLIGREGFAHPAVALGVYRFPYLVQIQVPDEVYTIALDPFRRAIDTSSSLRNRMLLYAHVYNIQTSFTVLSNASHQAEERLARWLLMCHDRSEGDELRLTHEFMSLMLGVRRPTVTNALHILEGNGFIRSERGVVMIRDRPAMLSYAADAYGAPEVEYDRLLGA